MISLNIATKHEYSNVLVLWQVSTGCGVDLPRSLAGSRLIARAKTWPFANTANSPRAKFSSLLKILRASGDDGDLGGIELVELRPRLRFSAGILVGREQVAGAAHASQIHFIAGIAQFLA